MTKRPVIGLTLDAEPAGGWSRLPWYALRQNYFSAVIAAGGLPVALPHAPELAARLPRGGGRPSGHGRRLRRGPGAVGRDAPHPKVTLKPGRTDFELAATRDALSRDKPVLGICGGQQLLAVALGATLHQHIPDEAPSDIRTSSPIRAPSPATRWSWPPAPCWRASRAGRGWR
jgi:putative glutamine amidotransferase